MDGFLNWVCPQAEKMLDFLIDTSGIIFGPIIYGLLWMTGFFSIGFAIWIIVGSLILSARKLFQDATRSLKYQWRTLLDNDPNKPRIPEVWYRRPGYAVCDPITNSSNSSNDVKKKKSDKKKLSLKVVQMKVKKTTTRLRRKTSRLEYRHRQEHETNPWSTRKHQQTAELSSEVEKLKSCILELSAYLRTVEESRAELLQRQTTWIYPYDKDLEIPGRIPTICARLPVPEFRISDVIDRRRAKPVAPFNITFYSMPETIVRSKASAPAARSLSSANSKTIDQAANQPVTSPAIIPSLPIAIPTVNTPRKIPKHTESPVKSILELTQPASISVPLPKSPPQPLAQPASTPPSLVHPSSQIATPAFSAVSKNNNWEVSKEGKLAKESKKKASDYNVSSESNSDENGNTALPSIAEPDGDDGKSKDDSLTLLPDSDENDVEGRDDDFPPLPDSDTGSDGENDHKDHNNRPDNAGSMIPSVIQQLVETFSDPAPAQESFFASSSVPAIIKTKVQGPSITPLGTQMEVDVHDKNVAEEDHTKIDAMDVDVQKETSEKEHDAAKDEMEMDIEHEKTKDDTGKDKMEVDIENETGATTDEMQLDDLDTIRGLKDVDMVNASQKIQKPTGDIEMRDGSTTPYIAPSTNVFAGKNTQHTIAEKPSTPLPNEHRSQQVMLRLQASNVRGETMSDEAPPPALESRDQRPVIIIRHNDLRRRRALEAKRRWLLAQEQEAAAAPEPAMEQFRNRPPPMVSSQGVSARENRLLLSGTAELRRELLHRLQALWPLLPKAEVDRVRLNNLRSKSLAEWRKLLNPAGKHALPDNTYIPRDAFEREAAEWMEKVVELMTKLKVIPEVGSLLETWRECVARQEPLPEPEDN
ncbi:uncharacterized protein LY79DRAFT_696190 [Colletotrichum navitas]|uniref:Uncharacterized protein n=1 Tax=Colletotrichum navitas TaxID=681940 RepID=A0AAD8Q7N2_9PEZI|nr:uncharacterized protein LY79DRAFT_696190 [Colletotrichum navitas]KAK1597473.1 hypothetical protein LY79DRAFT_696190 [Colletotrichum navitas]